MPWLPISWLGAMAVGTATPAIASDGTAPDAATGEFKAALERANRSFVQGDFRAALEILKPLCATSERPECDFGLGATYHALGECPQALRHYQRYRERAPEGEHVGDVVQAIEEVEAQCGRAHEPPAVVAAPVQEIPPTIQAPPAPTSLGADEPAQPPVHEPPPPAPPPDAGNGAWVGAFLGLSGAAAAGAVTLGVMAAQSADKCARLESYDGEFIDECEVTGPRYSQLAQGLAIAAGGFLAVGVSLWWLDSRSQAAVRISGNGGATLRYQGSF